MCDDLALVKHFSQCYILSLFGVFFVDSSTSWHTLPFLCLLFRVCPCWLVSHAHTQCSLPRRVLGFLPVRVRTFDSLSLFLSWHTIFFKPRIRQINSLQFKYYRQSFELERQHSLTCFIDYTPISEDGNVVSMWPVVELRFPSQCVMRNDHGLFLLMESDVFKSIVF